MGDPRLAPRQMTLADIPEIRASCPDLEKKARQEVAKQWLLYCQQQSEKTENIKRSCLTGVLHG